MGLIGEKIQNKKNKGKAIKTSLLKPNPSLFINFLGGTCLMSSLSSLLINYLHWHLKLGSSYEFGFKFSHRQGHS